MFLLEFLNRISFFSVLTWSFYLIAVLCALILTNYSSPMTRKYRKSLIAVAVSSIILGTLSWSSPLFMSKINPSQSRLVPIDSLVTTLWEEPVSNPETELPADEIAWAKSLPYKFKFKLQFSGSFKQAIVALGSQVAYLDRAGNLSGFNAYTGLNHWYIPVHATHVLDQIQIQKKLYLLDDTSLNVRISCFDLVTPSLLWQRMIPNSKEGALSFDPDSQSILVTAGRGGVWSMKAKTGEILWKRPELYSKVKAIVSPKHLVVFQPAVAGRPGDWQFLDLLNGKTLQKTPHVYNEIKSFLVNGSEPSLVNSSFLGEVNPGDFFYMSHVDLSQIWAFHADEAIRLTHFLDDDRFFFLYESSSLELRNLKDNSLIYQKKLAGIVPGNLNVSPDHAFLTIPSSGEDENPGISFFKLETGDYIVTARTSEKIADSLFFGDWLYLFSENYLWAFKK